MMMMMMIQPHSPSPSLSDLPTTAVHLGAYDHHDPTMSPSISGDDQDCRSPSLTAFEFSFHNSSCRMPSVPCIADELFLAGRLLPTNAEKPKCLKPPQEMDRPRKARPWYRLVFGFVRAPLKEMEVRDIRRRVKRKLTKSASDSEARKSSAGWRLIRSLSCSAMESVAVAATATVPMSIYGLE